MTVVNKGNNGGYSTLHFTANTVHTLADLQVAGETVNSAKIVDVYWTSAATGNWTVDRDAVNVLNLTGSGHWNFQENAVQFEAEADIDGDIDVKLNTVTDGTLIMKLHKNSDY